MDFNSLADSFSEFTMHHMKQQGLLYSFTNVYSLSLLSGMGIAMNQSEDLLHHIQDQLNQVCTIDQTSPIYDFSYKLTPLRAAYGKGVPKMDDNESLEEDRPLHWNKKTFKRTLSPETQALLIVNEVKLGKYLLEKSLLDENISSNIEEKYIGLLFIHMAKEQGLFCDQYLRGMDGLFIPKKDKSKDGSTIVLKQKEKEAALLDQALMMHAYALLFNVLSSPNEFPLCRDFSTAGYFHTLSVNLLDDFLSHEEIILGEKTKNLVTMIPLFVETIDILHGNAVYEDFITKLCAEVNARCSEDGKLMSEKFSQKTSSFSTHSQGLQALIEGYKRTHDLHFVMKAKKIYHHLNQYWNDSMDLFDYKGRKKIKYSAKDIGSIFGGLMSLYSLDTRDENKNLLTKQICSFFNASINISGIQIPPPILSEISQGLRSNNMDALNQSTLTNNTNSCVMLKDFKIYPKKNKIYIDGNKYNANYALHATKEILSLLDTE